MVRSYKKKTERKLPSPTKIKKGLQLIKSGFSLRCAAKQCGVNYACLNRLNKKTKLEDLDNLSNEALKLSHKSRSVFGEELESSIAEYCKQVALMGYGLSAQKVCDLAYETAIENRKVNPNLKIPPSWEKNKKAGEDWFAGFMKRHPDLSVRTPEGCSVARAEAFNKFTVNTFFDKLYSCLQRHPSFADGSRIGNLDETANSTVQNTRKLVSPKGIKQVHQIKSAERGVTVTTCCIVTALGSVIPPVMIFPRKKFVSAMMINAYPGALGLANENGYMTKQTFVQVMRHLIKHTSASKDNPFLLLVDNVGTHLSVESLNLAKENGITMLTFPPHCTHKLQPLDVSLFGPFKTYYDDAINSWLLQNPGQSITIYHIAGFVKTALMKSGTVQNITAGFAKTGIMPFDRNIFPDSEFIMASVTHKVDPNSQVEVLSIVPMQPETDTSLDANDNLIEIEVIDNSESMDIEETLEPSTSHVDPTLSSEETVRDSQAGQRSTFISPREFKGLPKAKEKLTTRKPRRKGKCCIATDTPEKREVEERQKAKDEQLKKLAENKIKRAEKKALKEKKKEMAQQKKKNKQTQEKKTKKKKVKNTARTLQFSDIESDNSDLDDNVEPLENSDTISSTDVPHPPTEGDFVLVLFSSKGDTYYVGKVIKDVDVDGECEISFYRKVKDRFVMPNVPDLCSVHLNDIKHILPKPTHHPAKTKRQQSYIGFDFNFNGFKLG